jgi:hypothetical protein
MVMSFVPFVLYPFKEKKKKRRRSSGVRAIIQRKVFTL